jgi:phospholipid/cholesterol/gamma-HCH transport system substrate-binding protein
LAQTPKASSARQGSPRTSGWSRAAAILAILAAIALAALLMFGGSDAYTVKVDFQNAGQLVKGNQVQVGGNSVGSIKDIKLDDNAQARIEIEVNDEFAPLHTGTEATIRATSLSGIANRYISLRPGPGNAPEIPDGGVIRADDTTSPVDLDQLFDSLDPATRRGLQQVVQGSAAQLRGKGRQANKSLEFLSPALSTSSQLTRELVTDDAVFERFVVDTSRLVTAVAERRGDLADLVGNANATSRAIAQENVALGRALGLLPTTLRRANTTFVNLRATLDDLDTLVAESKPATKELAPFFRRLRPLVEDARPTIHDLRLLIRRNGANNDLIELTSKMPKLESIASTTFPRAIRALQRAQPVVEYIRPYTPDLAGWFTKFGQAAANYDANGHFARIQPIFNAFQFTSTPSGDFLTDQGPNRLGGLQTQRSQRCPGGATQPPPDGSAPWRDSDGNLDCDPGTVPPGP